MIFYLQLLDQYPCPECGNVFYSNVAFVNHQCNKFSNIDTTTFCHPKECLRCHGKLYSYLSERTKTIQSICYACGYYWSNSSIYVPHSEELKDMIIRKPHLLKMIIKNPKINW